VTASGKIEIHADGKRILGNLRADGRNLGLAWFDIQSREDRESNCEL
jgi:hypothetical protein